MNIRALVFDVYSTILDVGPPPPNADDLWQSIFEVALVTKPPLTRSEFAIATARIIARMHAEAKARGIQWPEIQWPSVVLEAVPSLARLPATKLDDFLFRQMQIGRSLKLAHGAGDCLQELHSRGLLLAIASNSQAYTLRELDAAFSATRLNLSIFDPGLRFWSFENGFSKPDPHVFRILTARLEARGISPSETLMVGDRLDNDIEPSRAQGWQTWQLCSNTRNDRAGDWLSLLSFLRSKW